MQARQLQELGQFENGDPRAGGLVQNVSPQYAAASSKFCLVRAEISGC
jgi:hypothetical protein